MIDLSAFAQGYATLRSVAGLGTVIRQEPAMMVGSAFRALQAHDNRMTLAELGLIEKSPDYAILAGRGAV